MMTDQSYDDRDGWIWFDGEMLPWRDARVHVLTHALHYASSVFEGQRAYGGEIFKLSEHAQRLINSATLLGMEVPWTRAQIEEACKAVVARNGFADCYQRPIAWRGSEQMSVSAPRTKTHLAIAAWQRPRGASDGNAKGLRLNISPWRRPPPNTAPTAAKASGLYMICTMARHAAEDAGYDDALMFDWRGQVAEATSANIFFVKEGVLHTPTPDCFLDGITRRTVIDLARRRGIPVIERAIWPEDLETFEQAFLTGTAAEVKPIASIGSWSFEVGAIVKGLQRGYLDLVNGRLADA